MCVDRILAIALFGAAARRVDGAVCADAGAAALEGRQP